MRFKKVEGTQDLTNALTSRLNTALDEGNKVLWLVPGGSNITVAVGVMRGLNRSKLSNLTVALTDERYGDPGHADSNYFQLRKAGFNYKDAKFDDLLDGSTQKETVQRSNDKMAELFTSSDLVVGFLGMGSDGHIAGILPNSPATTEKHMWVVGYDGGQFQRITLTPFALSHIDEAIVGAFGVEKKPQFEKLCRVKLPIREMPAQILCHLNNVVIYNDQIGEE